MRGEEGRGRGRGKLRAGLGHSLAAVAVAVVVTVVTNFALFAPPPPPSPSHLSRSATVDPSSKLEPILLELAKRWQAGPLRAQALAEQRGIALEPEGEEGLVKVIIEPAGDDPSVVDRAALEALGARVEAVSKSLLRVKIPLSKLIPVAATVRGISFIRRPYRPHAVAVATLSEGVRKIGASEFHKWGYEGQGVKIAVIDLGFEGLREAIAAGEFGSGSGYRGSAVIDPACTRDYTGEGLEAGTPHGTAVAEIIHDVAPKATLCLMKIRDEVDLENAVAFAKSQGVKIINHSVTWFNTNFYDGTGRIAEIAAEAHDSGILWVNAAGNAGDPNLEGHWEGPFTDSDRDGYLDFGFGLGSRTDPIDGDMIDECNSFSAAAGERVNIFLTWDDWKDCGEGRYGCSDQDYDLELYDSSGKKVYPQLQPNRQSGSQPPVEDISYKVEESGTYCFAIKAYDAPRRPRLELFLFKENHTTPLNLEYHKPESSIPAPGNSSKVLTVGAISQGNWDLGDVKPEPFSSRGPTNVSKNNPYSIIKPDLMGPDGISTYTYGLRKFYGTSAAAPHVTGAAALLLSWTDWLGVDDLQEMLKRRAMAVDLGPPGKDNTYGWGQLRLVWRPPSEMKVYAEDAEVRVGETVAVPIIMSEAPYGLAGYTMTVSLRDPTIARIVSVEFVAFGAAGKVTISDEGDSATFQAADLGQEVQEGARDITLVRVHFEGLKGGIIEIQIRLDKLDADGGADLLSATSIENGTLIVLEGVACLPEPIGKSPLPPYDLDDDGLCEDVNGNGRLDFDDAVTLARNIDTEVVQLNWQRFDFNGNGRADFDDAVRLAFIVGGQAAAQALLELFGQLELELAGTLAYPNPAADGEAVWFAAEGRGIAQVKVEVYSLSGRLIYASGFAPGDRLSWDLRGPDGARLANGVYLYMVTVKGYGGELLRGKVKKLMVLR